MSLIPQNSGKAVLYGFMIWLSGFVWVAYAVLILVPRKMGQVG